ncbi:hypothetical protein TVAG_138380 [Trichomonas vaginalis G3]|uniref:Uncharacterized protein n=1 Tax=Trichomonas vaginalis (strain ATCC PRA-98 / G3) TaxID=412133 RepID=A2ENJ1_TRIV3|nr:hypothetical protein TVAGG3_0733230 [Trichomonas vaginalis G3]EAY05769.1 hypothetical protein TVAG_138380 [Trichomonas vaginalis G3]KAI5511408.1 hypothetical protein TVAGG3_0733230 [Trichomonas vaginalis G3]|eukprot:XP_001317992.1 hypothetical protein [Trichomonas vaginalis G3]
MYGRDYTPPSSRRSLARMGRASSQIIQKEEMYALVVLRSARQLNKYSYKHLSLSVKIHDELEELKSNIVYCTTNQVDFQMAYMIDLSDSKIIPNLSHFYLDIALYTNDQREKQVASAFAQSSKQKSPGSVNYIANHEDIRFIRLGNSAPCGTIMSTLCIGSLNSLQVLEPSITPITIKATDIMIKKSIIQEEVHTPMVLTTEQIREIWQKIAIKNGWKPPKKLNLDIDTFDIFDKEPCQKPRNTEHHSHFLDMMYPYQNNFHFETVFDRIPSNEMEENELDASLSFIGQFDDVSSDSDQEEPKIVLTRKLDQLIQESQNFFANLLSSSSDGE